MLYACSTNDVSALQALLEEQDRQLFSQTAQTGTVNTAAYLLSRHQVPEDYSRHVLTLSPTQNPIQYLTKESARHGNTVVFCYLLSRYPELLSTKNRNVESILVNALDGGVEIWKIILEHDPRWKDHEFSGHRGYVLELLVDLKKPILLEFLLQEGADTDRAGDPVLDMAKARRASPEILELIKKYSHWEANGSIVVS